LAQTQSADIFFIDFEENICGTYFEHVKSELRADFLKAQGNYAFITLNYFMNEDTRGGKQVELLNNGRSNLKESAVLSLEF